VQAGEPVAIAFEVGATQHAPMTTALTGAPAPRSYAKLPGPRGLPLLGSALALDPSNLHHQLVAWADTYGPAFRMSVGRRRFLVLTDHAAIQSALRDRPTRFRRPDRSGARAREMGFDDGLFFANGEVWARQRRIVMAGFNPAQLKAYFDSIRDVAARLERRWRTAARRDDEIDVQADLMRYTVDVVAGLAFGHDVDTLSTDGDAIPQHLNRIFPALWRRTLAPIPWWRWFPTRGDRELDASVAEVQAAIRGFVAAARARLAADPARRARPANVLEAMLVAAEDEGHPLADADVAGNVFVLLLAGEDTTANTIAWLVHLLHANPAALARARDEVRRVAPSPAAFTPESVAALEYVEACLHETMRLKPVAPLLTAEAVVDTELAGVAVPTGVVVFAVLRHDSVREPWVAAPTEFRPERWLDPAQVAGLKRVSMPFGAGSRICPGRGLALLEMKMAAAVLLGSFAELDVYGAGGRPVREQMAFAMGPVGLRMRLREGDEGGGGR
jgi:cytochrome P450